MQYIEFGKITSTHGIKGEMKIYPYTDDVDNILKQKKVYINSKEYTVSSMKFHKNMFITKLKEIDTIEQAEKFRNFIIQRELDENEVLEEDTYYIKDLVKCTVFLEDGTEFGKLIDVFQTGANDVYVIKTTVNNEVLIPAIKDVVKDIDIKTKKIVIELMEGLI